MGIHKIKFTKPAAIWEEALVIGNGKLGAAIYGGTELERIQLNTDTLWSGTKNKRDKKNDKDFLADVRKLLFECKYAEADKFFLENSAVEESQTYLPLGNVYIKFDKYHSTKDYMRELVLETATVNIKHTQMDFSVLLDTRKDAIERRCYASHPHDVIVYKIAHASRKKISMTIMADSDLKHTKESEPDRISVCGKAPDQVDMPYEGMPYTYSSDDTVRFCYSVTALNVGGSRVIENDKIGIYNAEEVLIIIAAETDFVSYDSLPDKSKDLKAVCRQKTDKVISDGEEAVYKEHLEDYKALYDRCSLEFGGDESEVPVDERRDLFQKGNEDNNLVETAFQFGRYLMIASSRAGSQATNLQGIWSNQLQPLWKCNYTTNINTQMNYWPAEICNLSECHEPLMEFIKELSEAGRQQAKDLYGCDGFVVHHNTDLWRMTSPAGTVAKCMSWPVAGGWMCQHLMEHYSYTKDEKFLKETAYPIIKECTKFFLDFLVYDEKRGYLVTAPSTSPENYFYDENKNVCGVCVGSAMDMAIIDDTFDNFLTLSEILNETDEVERTKAAKAKLLPFTVGEKGQLIEWGEDFEGTEPGHRHISHLYGVFPGHAIKADNKEIFDACKKSLDLRIENGSGYTGWSSAWISNMFISFGDGERAWEYIRNTIGAGMYDNLLGRHPPFQIDCNFGLTMAIARMFMVEEFKTGAELDLLPDCMKDGSLRGFCLPDNKVLDMEWKDKRITMVNIYDAKAATKEG